MRKINYSGHDYADRFYKTEEQKERDAAELQQREAAQQQREAAEAKYLQLKTERETLQIERLKHEAEAHRAEEQRQREALQALAMAEKEEQARGKQILSNFTSRGRSQKPLNEFASRLAQEKLDLSPDDARSEIKSRIRQESTEQKRALNDAERKRIAKDQHQTLNNAMRAFRRARKKNNGRI